MLWEGSPNAFGGNRTRVQSVPVISATNTLSYHGQVPVCHRTKFKASVPCKVAVLKQIFAALRRYILRLRPV
jgi:hypothetical protein